MEINRIWVSRCIGLKWRELEADGSSSWCFAHQALVRLALDGVREYFCIMIPATGFRGLPPLQWLPNQGRLCATSQIRANYCNNLKNFAFHIEPAAAPIRPILRDGH